MQHVSACIFPPKGGGKKGRRKKKNNHNLKKKPVEMLAGRGPLSQGEGYQQLCNSSCPGGTLPHAPNSCGCGKGLFWRGEGCFSAAIQQQTPNLWPRGAELALLQTQRPRSPDLHLSHFHATAPKLKQRSHQSSPEHINP